jgi:hypothetical protein
MIISFRAARESQGRKKGLVKIFRAVPVCVSSFPRGQGKDRLVYTGFR